VNCAEIVEGRIGLETYSAVKAAHSFIVVFQKEAAIYERSHYVLIAFETDKCAKAYILTGKLLNVGHGSRADVGGRMILLSEMAEKSAK
jgi:hypothetical protein